MRRGPLPRLVLRSMLWSRLRAKKSMVAENCQSKNPPFEGKIVLFIIIFSSDLYICFFLFTNLFIYLIFDEIK